MFDGERHRIPLSDLAGGRSIVIYGQTEVVKDLIAARLARGAPLIFEAERWRVDGLEPSGPASASLGGSGTSSSAISSPAATVSTASAGRAIPAGVLRTSLANTRSAGSGSWRRWRPSSDELIYAHHERGFALLQPPLARAQPALPPVRPDEDLDEWPDERIWDELRPARRSTADARRRGRSSRRASPGCAASSSSRCSTAGSSWPATPLTSFRQPAPRGSTSRLRTSSILAEALVAWYRDGDRARSTVTRTTCLRRVWRAEHFSGWMTSMLHRAGDSFDLKLQLSQLRYVTTSTPQRPRWPRTTSA